MPKKSMRDRLTAKQKKYCKARADGMGYADSYRAGGYAYKDTPEGRDTAAHNAMNLENYNPLTTTKIQQEIQRLQEQAEAGAILNRQQRQAALSNIAMDGDESTTDRLRAFDQLNRMSGDYTDRVQVEATAKLSYADRLDAISRAMDEE